MRVTSMMQNTQLLRNIRNNNSGIIDWQNKLATGQRIHRPGDDPVGIGYLMRYNSELNRTNEFLENAKTGLGYLKTMDELMQQSSDVLKRPESSSSKQRMVRCRKMGVSRSLWKLRN